MKRALIFWFTGLSGAGKSTIAGAAREQLQAAGYSVQVVDGDLVRQTLHRHLGFSEADIKENNRLIIELCERVRSDHDVIMVTIVSPYAVLRAEARRRLSEGFYEIFIDADIETVFARDVKGLYEKARKNEITNLIGYSDGSRYEPPAAPDLVLDTANEPADESVRKFMAFVRSRFSGAAVAPGLHAGSNSQKTNLT